MIRVLTGDHRFTENEAIEAGDLLGLAGVHRMPGHFHPGRTHMEYEQAVRRLAACARALTSNNITTATAERGFGRREMIQYRANNGFLISRPLGVGTEGKLYILESSMASITSDPNFTGLENTIGDDGEEIRVANLPRQIFDKIPLTTDHLSIFSFAYIDIDMLQREFNERVNNYPIRLDFTFSNVTTAIVQSNTYIPTLAETAEDALSPDTSNTSPQASIFQDLRGVFAASNRTLGGPNFATDTASSSGVSLAGFEDEISAMSVDEDGVNEEIRNFLTRQATVFSDLWTSRRRSDAVDLSFAFNERLFLKQSSTFPKLYDNQRFSYLAEGLGGGVSRIRVYKQLINPNFIANENSLNTTSRSSLMFGRNQDKQYISVGPRNEMLINNFSEQIYFGANGEKGSVAMGLKFLTCTDYENENARNTIGSTYRYGVEIDYVDPTIDMVLKMTNGLLEKAQVFNDIANDLGTMPSTTPEDRRKLHQTTEERCNRILRIWAPLLDDLASINIVQGAGEISGYLRQLKGNSEQTVYERAEGILRIADVFEFYGSELEIELRKTIPGVEVYPGDDSPGAANYASSGGSGAGGTSRSINTIDHIFKKTIPADQQSGYDYLRYEPIATSNPGLEVVTLSNFLTRCDIETEKYYNDSEGVRGLTTAKVKYFTPAVVLNPLGQALVQNSDTMSDYKKYINFTAGVISHESQKSNGISVNNNRLGADVDLDIEKMFIDELLKQGVSVEFVTDKNRSKDPLLGKSSFAGTVLGQTEKEISDKNQEDLKDRVYAQASIRGESLEVRDNKTKSKDVKKGLANLVGSLALSSDKSGVGGDKANSFTKVVLEAPEAEFADLTLFPNQLKAMVNIVMARHDQDKDEYARYNYNFDEIRSLVGPNNQVTGLTDPMRDYSRFASYWLNYKQIKKIEILVGFTETNSGQVNIANATWREIRLEDINTLPRSSVLFCRFSPLTGDLVEMLGLNAPSGLDLPTYNQYFLLARTNEERDLRVVQEEIAEEPPPQTEPEDEQQTVLTEDQYGDGFPKYGIIPDLDIEEITLDGNTTTQGVSVAAGVSDRIKESKYYLPPKEEKYEDIPPKQEIEDIPPKKEFEDLLDKTNKMPASDYVAVTAERDSSSQYYQAQASFPQNNAFPTYESKAQTQTKKQNKQYSAKQQKKQSSVKKGQTTQQGMKYQSAQYKYNAPSAGMGNFGKGVTVSSNVAGNVGGGYKGGGGYI
tara:strand:- start:2373 stop:6035 length:3663 start_codon:yes stop_codon:yes gene_type:complete